MYFTLTLNSLTDLSCWASSSNRHTDIHMASPDGIPASMDWIACYRSLWDYNGWAGFGILTASCWWFMSLTIRQPHPTNLQTLQKVVLWEGLTQLRNYWKHEWQIWDFSSSRPGKCLNTFLWLSTFYWDFRCNKRILLSDISTILWWGQISHSFLTVDLLLQ